VFLGELGLDGAIPPVRGVLSVARHFAARDSVRSPVRGLVLPPGNVKPAPLIDRFNRPNPSLSVQEVFFWSVSSRNFGQNYCVDVFLLD